MPYLPAAKRTADPAPKPKKGWWCRLCPAHGTSQNAQAAGHRHYMTHHYQEPK